MAVRIVAALQTFTRPDRASETDRNPSILERASVGRGAGLRADPCHIRRRYCCIISVRYAGLGRGSAGAEAVTGATVGLSRPDQLSR